MSTGDELDVVLCRLSDDNDRETLANILQLKNVPSDNKDFNKLIRRAYSHIYLVPFRGAYKPDYLTIVRQSARKIGVNIDQEDDVEQIEEKIIPKVLEIMRDQIVKEEGQEAWDRIEEDARSQVEDLVNSGKLPRSYAEVLSKTAPGVFMAALLAGKLSGFTLYIVANQLFFALARSLGLKVGVAVAGPMIGKTLAFLLGPVGWGFAAIWLVAEFGNTNWKKIVPAVVFVAVIRRKLAFEIAQNIGG